MNRKILRVVNGVSMALGHDGLRLVIKKETGIDVQTLGDTDIIICINAAQDKLKAIGGGGLALGYLRMPRERKLMKEAIQFLPRVFGGDGFTYDDACKEAMSQLTWNRRLVVPEKTTRSKFVTAFIKEATR